MISMKTLFRVLALGILLTAFSALTFAQEPDLATLFEQFKKEGPAATKENKMCGKREAALVTGKTIVDKFGTDEDNKAVIDFVKNRMAAIEKEDPVCKRNERYDATYKAKDWAGFFAVSKEIIAAPDSSNGLDLDVMLTAVSVGYNATTVDKVDTYNNDTLNFAKTALQKIESGKTSQTGKWGVFEPFKTKEAAQSWLNYTVGYINFYRLGATDPTKKKEALSYFYKSTQVSNERKGDYTIYANIGAYYFDEAARLTEDYKAKLKANNNEENDETKGLLALARGTADRASDAYGRAYKIVTAPGSQEKPETKTGISKTLTELYKFRFNLTEAKQADVDAYVNGLTAKAMPDPATAVTPVVEEVKPTATTTTPTTTTTPVTTTTKPTTTTTTKTTTTATTTKPTAPVKKPVTKKKGTR